MKDMFEENEKSDNPVEHFPVEFDNDEEIDASEVNFSDPEVLDWATETMGETLKKE